LPLPKIKKDNVMPFRVFLIALRRVVYFFTAGGAIHDRADYPWTVKQLRPAVQLILHNRRGIYSLLYCLRAARWIRLTARIYANSVELRLDPGSWPGRLLLKLFPILCFRLLRRLHALIYEAAREQAHVPDRRILPAAYRNHFGVLLKILYRFRWLPVERLRLSGVFFLALKETLSDIPPFHSSGPGWLLAASLFAITAKSRIKIPGCLFLSGRLQSVVWQLHPVMLIRHDNGRHLHGYLMIEREAESVRQHRSFFYLPLAGGGLALHPGRYGGFEKDFPFKNTDHPTFLFFERPDSFIDCYQMLAEYPANHLQRFSVRRHRVSKPGSQKKRPFVEEEARAHKDTEPDSFDFDGALYLSRMDIHLKTFFRLRRSDCLWRPALDPPPDLRNSRLPSWTQSF
jgi:hypothetical protein